MIFLGYLCVIDNLNLRGEIMPIIDEMVQKIDEMVLKQINAYTERI